MWSYPKVSHATEWIAAGFPACVYGRSAPLGGRGPQQFILGHLGDNESRLSSPCLGESFLHLEYNPDPVLALR
jgi:hypothetical protein